MFPLNKKRPGLISGELLVEQDRTVQSSMILNDLEEGKDGEETNKIMCSKKNRSEQERVAEGSPDTEHVVK